MIDIDSLPVAEATVLPAKLQWQLVHYWRDTGQFARAHALIDEHARQSGPTITGLMERSRNALAEGDVDLAISSARERHALSASMSATLDLARAELAAGHVAAAMSHVRRLLAEGSTAPSVRMLEADIHLANGNQLEAERIYVQALDGEFPALDAYLGLARIAIDRAAPEVAREHLDLLISEPDRLDLRKLHLAAGLYEMLGDQERAARLRKEAAAKLDALRDQLSRDVQARLGAVAHLGGDAVDFGTMPSQTVGSEAPPPLDDEVFETLHRVFGFPDLRPGQANVVAKVMAGRDTLAIMPTGSGKSLTFQLPSLLLPGVTIVISPLIALMKDQVDSLPLELRSRTRLINSTLSREEMQAALDELKAGALKLVYVAPERLRDRTFLQAMQATQVSLVVVDEAHCISLWGQDFRPDYLFIPRAVAAMGQPPVLAVTATATPAMADQIASGLGREMALCRVSLFRPNLYYEVRRAGSREFKIREMIDICKGQKGSGIVYVNSRKDTESFAALLRDNGVSAIAYHAGLDPAVRAQSQDRFMSGQVRVVVATIAFGMGVDKANVRFILHFNPPTSLEAYAQESGRAGRDGEPARCILLATKTDETRLRNFSGRDALGKDELRRVYANLKRRAAGRWALLERSEVDSLSGDPEIDSRVALGLLEQAGMISRHPDVPWTFHLSWDPHSLTSDSVEPGWERLLARLGPDATRGRATIDVREFCRDPEWSPLEIDRILATQPAVLVREGSRVTCIELLPAGADAPARVDKLLADVEALAERRIQQVMAYTKRRTCRHVMLAAQFGERLQPCGSSCDVCAGAGALAAAPAAAETRPASPALSGPDAALAVLTAVRTLPFPVGRTGLVRLVTGSAESRIRADRSPSFGVLKGMTKGRVEKLVDRLIELGYLFRDMSHEYLLISLTEKGQRADREELAHHFIASAAQSSSSSAADSDLLQRLREWRTERARKDAVPPYVIAQNSVLEALAASPPRSHGDLAEVPGLGPAKIARYGNDILSIING